MLDKKITNSGTGRPTLDQSPLHSRVSDGPQDQLKQTPATDSPIDELESDGSGDAFTATEEVKE